MKKNVFILMFISFIGLSQEIKKENQSDSFNLEMKKIKRKAQLSTIDKKVKLRNYINLICSKDISFVIKKRVYDELIKEESLYFKGYLKNKKFDVLNLKSVYKAYEESLDELAFVKEFVKFSDSINKDLILYEMRLKELEDELKNAKE
ncbi:hypothetical protein [Flavobacterium psychrophilum]|uniref:hypothetical protein n=1 Tax=Flavobacterium psychrophilum TaxID=96345 RepID=UPI001151DA71|nr:hypothetical protein [Flavobacterium psychrophilum]